MGRRRTAWRRWSTIVKRCSGSNSEEAERSADTVGAVPYSMEGGTIEEMCFGVVRFLLMKYTRTCALLDAMQAVLEANAIEEVSGRRGVEGEGGCGD